jgi:hypothetical protein
MATLALMAMVALVLAAPAFAGDEVARGASVRGAASDMQVAVDPVTGKLRQPTPAEVRALLRQARTMTMTKSDTNAMQFTTWPDGTISGVLTPEYLNVWLGSLNADGSVYQICVDGDNAATATPTPGLEEK